MTFSYLAICSEPLHGSLSVQSVQLDTQNNIEVVCVLDNSKNILSSNELCTINGCTYTSHFFNHAFQTSDTQNAHIHQHALLSSNDSSYYIERIFITKQNKIGHLVNCNQDDIYTLHQFLAEFNHRYHK